MLDDAETQNTQFIPGDDDDEQLWDVEKILNEKKGQYLIRWKGFDENGKPWDDSWVPKCDVTDDLISEWKALKKEREERRRSMPGPSTASKKKKLCAYNV